MRNASARLFATEGKEGCGSPTLTSRVDERLRNEIIGCQWKPTEKLRPASRQQGLGVGSVRSATLAGPIIGVEMAFTALISAGLSKVVVFVLMANILLTKQMGLFGDKL